MANPASLAGTSTRHLDEQSNAIISAQGNLDSQAGQEGAFSYRALDGLYGDYEISAKTDRKLAKDIYLAGELAQLDGVISVACLMPSDSAEPCGSLVNLGQGLALQEGENLPEDDGLPAGQCHPLLQMPPLCACLSRACHFHGGSSRGHRYPEMYPLRQVRGNRQSRRHHLSMECHARAITTIWWPSMPRAC